MIDPDDIHDAAGCGPECYGPDDMPRTVALAPERTGCARETRDHVATDLRTVAIAGRCTMPTSTGALCRRTAAVQYLRADGSQVAAYCLQHDRATGPRARMLRCQPWEYSERRMVAEFFPGTDVRRGPFGPSATSRSLYVN